MSEENKKSAEETVATTEVDEHADIGKNTEGENDVEFTDSESGEQGRAEPNEESKTQTKEQNSENARRRREAERQAELKKVEAETREKAIIEVLNGKNPFTNEPMKDHADVEEYLLMKEIEKNGGDPLSDFSKYQKEKERKKAEEVAKETEEKEWYEKDFNDFSTKHPEVNVHSLISNEQFQKFADGKVGKQPLSEIYDDFISFVSEYEKKAKQMVKQTLANKKASPGSLSSTNPNDSGYYTREQVQAMTQEEVHKNYDKIRASMSKWKY